MFKSRWINSFLLLLLLLLLHLLFHLLLLLRLIFLLLILPFLLLFFFSFFFFYSSPSFSPSPPNSSSFSPSPSVVIWTSRLRRTAGNLSSAPHRPSAVHGCRVHSGGRRGKTFSSRRSHHSGPGVSRWRGCTHKNTAPYPNCLYELISYKGRWVGVPPRRQTRLPSYTARYLHIFVPSSSRRLLGCQSRAQHRAAQSALYSIVS